MRVASLHMTRRYLNQLNKGYERQTKLMEQGDGDKLHRPSDNPVWYSKYLRFSNSYGENNQFQDNVQTAVSWMKNSDGALINMSDELKTFVAKSNQAQDTMTDEDMKLLSAEMQVLIEQVVSDGNSNISGRYLFSGQKDLVMPYVIAPEKDYRGIAKTMDDRQMDFFNDCNQSADIRQMLVMKGSDGEEYYLNTLTGDIYSKEFVDTTYKQRIIEGQDHVIPANDRVGNITFAAGDVAKHFDQNGIIKAASKDVNIASITVNGQAVNLQFDYIHQYIVKYYGDDKHFSMVREAGATKPATDTVNCNGQDIAGFTIFDDANSGNEVSGCAAFNDAFTVVAKLYEGDAARWMSSDGKALANNSFNIINLAQARLASRQQSYTDCKEMLTIQNESILGDITEVHSADIAKLSVDLMQAQTVYNLSLSIGARIIPPTLADYLG